jgi:hypothetical protein
MAIKSKLIGLVLMGLFAVSCDGGKATSPAAQFVGSWRLDRLNGDAMPSLIYDDGVQQLVVDSISIEIEENGTWSDGEWLRKVVLGETQRINASDHGAWLSHGSSITMSSDEGSDPMTGTLSGATLTIDIDEDDAVDHFVFRRK